MFKTELVSERQDRKSYENCGGPNTIERRRYRLQYQAPYSGYKKTYSEQHKMLTMMANYNVESGGWTGTGRSAVYWAGQELVCADRKQNQLVIAEHKNGRWQGDLRSLELLL